MELCDIGNQRSFVAEDYIALAFCQRTLLGGHTLGDRIGTEGGAFCSTQTNVRSHGRSKRINENGVRACEQ